MPNCCQSRESTKAPVFRMIWVVKDEAVAKLTPFLNNGQGDSEIGGIDNTASPSRQRRPLKLNLRPTEGPSSTYAAFFLRNDFPIGHNKSCRLISGSEKRP